MSDAPPPSLPFDPPPSIEEAVQEHINVKHTVERFQLEQTAQRKAIAELAANVARLVEAQTVDRLTLGRVEKLLTQIRADQVRTEELRRAVLKAVASV
jgi:hypothetical protein